MTQTITIIIWVVAIAVAIWAVLQKRNWVILLMMAVLVGVSVYWIIPPGAKTRLGLDLQGGLQIVYTARTSDGSAPTQAQLDQTVGILDRRVNGLGVTESQIQKQGSDQISVALPGIKNAEQALAVIGKTAQLQFFKDDSASRPVGSRLLQGGGAQGAGQPGRLQGGDRRSCAPRARARTTRSCRARRTRSTTCPSSGTCTSSRRP